MTTKHVVHAGECLASIAQRYGFRSWRTIYDHPDNAALKRKRPNPNVIHPGDEVAIPDRDEAAWSVPTTQLHRFAVKTSAKVLRLRLLDREERPLANAAYRLDLGRGLPIEGTTDADGLLEQPIPIGAGKGVLHVDDRELHLSFGHVNPLRDAADGGVSGAQARLRNLGYPVGRVDGVAGLRTRTAIGLFQKDHDLEATCALDDATLAKLEEAHGA